MIIVARHPSPSYRAVASASATGVAASADATRRADGCDGDFFDMRDVWQIYTAQTTTLDDGVRITQLCGPPTENHDETAEFVIQRRFHAPIVLCQIRIPCLLDTGATCNLVAEFYYLRMINPPTMQPTDYSYGRHTIRSLEVLGIIYTDVSMFSHIDSRWIVRR